MSLKYTNFNVTTYTSDSSTSHTFLIENIGVIDTYQSYFNSDKISSVVISCGPLHLEVDFGDIYESVLDFLSVSYTNLNGSSLNFIPFFFDRYFPVFKFKGMLRLTFHLNEAKEMILHIYRRPEKYFSGSTYKFLHSQIFTPTKSDFNATYRPFIRPFCFVTNDDNVSTINFLVNEYSLAKGIYFYEFPPNDQLDDTSYVKVINTNATPTTSSYMLTAKGYIDFSEDVVKICEGVKNETNYDF